MSGVCGKYRFARALRPFSLVVALVSCGLGAALAMDHPQASGLNAGLVILAGILLQAGVNLINDRADLALIPLRPELATCAATIRRNFRYGWICFALAGLLSLPLFAHAGWPLLALVVVGAAGAVGYTQEPVHYKRRGLGVPLVFVLMGVLMVAGAQLAVSGSWQWRTVWLSIPPSLMVALLLLSNELRDFERDRADGLHTLSVRIGYERAAWLYRLMLLLALLAGPVFALLGLLPGGWLVLALLPLLPGPLRLLHAGPAERLRLTPLSGRLLALYGLLYIAAVLWR